MFVLLGKGLWEGPITRTEEPYRLCGVCECDGEAQQWDVVTLNHVDMLQEIKMLYVNLWSLVYI